MAQTRKKPAITADQAPIVADAGTIRQALDELAIDRPYMGARVVGNRLELTLYGGDVVTWPPKPARKPRARAPKED
jgi:hypothetical protein